LKNTTIANTISKFKSFLRWAKKNGYYNGSIHDDFTTRLKGTDGNNKEVIHLTWDELLHLYNFEFECDYQREASDVFCFCCFTSLRYSDVLKLKKSDVNDKHITVVTQKTVDGLKIDLNKYSKAILDKYKDSATEYALPVPKTNTTMNTYLKEIAKIAGFNESQKVVYFIGNQRYEKNYPKYELLTSHCGRRTFIVISLYLGIPAEVVMKWTGHKHHVSMKPYVKIVDDLKADCMKKFDLK
jgi:integrase